MHRHGRFMDGANNIFSRPIQREIQSHRTLCSGLDAVRSENRDTVAPDSYQHQISIFLRQTDLKREKVPVVVEPAVCRR